MTELIVSEYFGITLQGEGRSAGRPAFFLRLGMCNLDCKWCDTPYTWDWQGKNGQAYSKKSLIHMSIDDVLGILPEGCPRLVITGGEPMIQRRAIAALVEALPEDCAVEIETNGTLDPSGLPPWVHFNVSPKLPNSGVDFGRAIQIDHLRTYAELGADFKFVVARVEDIQLIADLEEIIKIDPSHIWLMPEGRSKREITRDLDAWFMVCADNGWNLSTRLHVLAFGDKRGI